jgi:type I restriction enzyme S subunit
MVNKVTPDGWRVCKLGELGQVVTGKTPPTKHKEYYGGETPFITPTDMDGRKVIASTQRYLTEEGVQSVRSSLIPKGTVFVSCIGSDMGKVGIAGSRSVTNQQINSIIVELPNDPEYVYYHLTTRKEELQRLATSGSAQPILNKGHFSEIDIILPSPAEQRAIAHILGTLDDKIELNHRINQTLEAMVQALFKSWFVDFEPFRAQGMQDSPLGEIPVGWRVGKLEEIAYFIKGVSYRSDDLQDSDVALVTLKSVARGGGYQPQGLKPYTGEYESEQELRPGEVIVAHTDLTQKAEVLGRAVRVQAHPAVRTLVASLDLVIVRPTQHKASNEFLYGLLSRDEFQEHAYGYANGTTVLHLSTKALPEYQCIIPPPNIISDYTRIISPLYQLFDSNEMQSSILVSIRDILLPKLLSGEIRVKDAEKFVERAL